MAGTSQVVMHAQRLVGAAYRRGRVGAVLGVGCAVEAVESVCLLVLVLAAVCLGELLRGGGLGEGR